MTSAQLDDKTISLLTSAFELHQAGRYQEAEKVYRPLLEQLPDSWYLHYNFGLLLYETARFPKALEHYQTAVALEHANIDIHYNLALCYKKCGDETRAIESYHNALELDPGDTDCLFNLGNCLLELGRFGEAIKIYKNLIKLDPQHKSAHNNLAFSFHRAGMLEEAIIWYRKLLSLDPDHEAADYMLASLTGEFRDAAPASYIRELFDNYSDTYEQSLVSKLEYRVPGILFEFIKKQKQKIHFKRLLDLGCGTGLVGTVFRDSVEVMDGIDLSEQMISAAQKKKIYDRLIVGDLHMEVGNLTDSYDLLIAADVFSYLGKLEHLFPLLGTIAAPDCFLYFTVESTEKSEEVVLQSSGRFSHSRAYIERITASSGWFPAAVNKINLRKERDSWVKGDLYAFSRRAT